MNTNVWKSSFFNSQTYIHVLLPTQSSQQCWIHQWWLDLVSKQTKNRLGQCNPKNAFLRVSPTESPKQVPEKTSVWVPVPSHLHYSTSSAKKRWKKHILFPISADFFPALSHRSGHVKIFYHFRYLWFFCLFVYLSPPPKKNYFPLCSCLPSFTQLCTFQSYLGCNP